MDKKFKAQDKLKRRKERKNAPETAPVEPTSDSKDISEAAGLAENLGQVDLT